MRLCINSNRHVGVEESWGQRDERDAAPAGKARRGKPTREVCVQAHLTGLYKEVAAAIWLVSQSADSDWLGTARSLPRTHIPERSEVADVCVP